MKTERNRAGLFRRGFPLFVDATVVFVPFQIVAAILFAITAGQVQFNHGVTFTSCYKATGVPADLKPAPPENANAARVCKTTFFGAEIARHLTVSRITKTDSTTTSVGQTYMLDAHDKPIDGWSLDWPAWLALLAYLFTMRLRRGGTLGDRTNKIILVDDSLKTMSPPGVRQMAVRTLVQIGPMAAAVLATLMLAYLDNDSAEQLTAAGHWIWLIAFAAPVVLFYLVSGIQIALKRDPPWDRVARTAMLVRAAE